MSLTDKSVEGNKSAFSRQREPSAAVRRSENCTISHPGASGRKDLKPSKRGRVLPLQREALIDVGERVF